MKTLHITLVLLISLFCSHHSIAASNIYNLDELDLNDHKGKLVYLDFWASWCKPCRKSFPWMNQLTTKFGADKITVITINLDANEKLMHEFLEKTPANFDIYKDPDGQLAEKFQLQGMPTSYIINQQGSVVKRHIGFKVSDIPEYEKEIEGLL